MYRQVFVKNNIVYNPAAGVYIGTISNFETLIYQYVKVGPDTGQYIGDSRSGYLSANYYSGIQVSSKGRIDVFAKDGDEITGEIIVIVEYTKTTDQGGNA